MGGGPREQAAGCENRSLTSEAVEVRVRAFKKSWTGAELGLNHIGNKPLAPGTLFRVHTEPNMKSAERNCWKKERGVGESLLSLKLKKKNMGGRTV